MMILNRFMLYLMIFAFPYGYLFAKDTQPIKLTVCQIAAMKSAYKDKVVQISGLYKTNMKHGAYLRDQNCPNKSVHIGFYVDKTDKSIIEFERDQHIRYTTPLEVREIQMTVIGKLVYDEDVQENVQKKKYVFRIIKYVDYKFLPTNK